MGLNISRQDEKEKLLHKCYREVYADPESTKYMNVNSTASTALNASIEDLQRVHYKETELAEIRAFLTKFSDTAVIYLCRLLERAKVYKHAPPFEQVMKALHGYDRLVWQWSSPWRYGDPDDTGVDYRGECFGARNAGAIANVYKSLQIPIPKGIH